MFDGGEDDDGDRGGDDDKGDGGADWELLILCDYDGADGRFMQSCCWFD